MIRKSQILKKLSLPQVLMVLPVIFHPTNIHFDFFLLFAGLPWWLSRLRVLVQSRRCESDAWAGTVTWRRKRQTTPVLLPGKSYGQRDLAGYSSWGHKRVSQDSNKKTTTICRALCRALSVSESSKINKTDRNINVT